jgi:general secretion pathway protein F/type IV pilus assembly protein PilC
MPDFRYTAKNADGDDVVGVIEAVDKRDAIESLGRQVLFPIVVEAVRGGQIEFKWLRRRPSEQVVASTLSQLADLLDNGVPILMAFQVLVRQTEQPVMKDVLKDIYEKISEGESIDRAFAAHGKIFSNLTLSIIRAGTEGAFLEDALRRTAVFLEQSAETRGKVTGAMIYPTILATIGIIVVGVLLRFFVPMFQPMFDQTINSGGKLPVLTIIMLTLNRFLMHYGLVTCIAIFLLGIVLQGQLATTWGQKFLDRYKLKIPILGKVLLETSVSRFCRVLGTLLENGVPILRALDISSYSTGNLILADAIQRSVENVSAGEPLSKPLAEIGIIPPQVMAMISVAEESNTLETVLVKIADTLERQNSRRIDTLVRFIEPIMLLIMAAVIFCIILALMQPIFELNIG